MARRFDRLTKEQRDELLSAYLDDQMDAGGRARLEAQLAADPALRAELEALRHTVALVRDLPPQSIPRNFILPRTSATSPRPAPTARSRRRWLAPFLTAATSVVSLLFVVVLAGDLFFSGAGAVTQLAAPVAEKERAVAESSPGEGTNGEDEAEKVFSITESPEEEAPSMIEAEGTSVPDAAEIPTDSSLQPTPLPGTPGETKEGDDEGEHGPELTLEAESTSVPSAAESPIPPTGGGGELPTELPASTPTSTGKAGDAVAQTKSPEKEETAPAPAPLPTTVEPSEPDLRDTEPAPDDTAETELPPPTEGGDANWGSPTFSVLGAPWRVLEVALGVAALLLTLAMVWAWRARRR